MNQKLVAYDKVCNIIRSCRDSRQNNVAYVVIQNFARMYGNDSYALELYTLCDLNLQQIIGGYGGLPKQWEMK